MKRRISLVIAFALSFLMMFSPIARAEGINVQIPVPTSESSEIIIKVPLAETNQADSPPPQVKATEQILQQGEQTSKQETNDRSRGQLRCDECYSGGAPGECVPILYVQIRNQEVQIKRDPCGDCQPCFR